MPHHQSTDVFSMTWVPHSTSFYQSTTFIEYFPTHNHLHKIFFQKFPLTQNLIFLYLYKHKKQCGNPFIYKGFRNFSPLFSTIALRELFFVTYHVSKVLLKRCIFSQILRESCRIFITIVIEFHLKLFDLWIITKCI